jgi:hypothetical protein
MLEKVRQIFGVENLFFLFFKHCNVSVLSLNISVSAGIVIWDFVRKLQL